MAVARQTPKCQFCGKPTATARHNNMGKNFVGDTFLGWIYKECECEEAKNEREKIQKKQDDYWKKHPKIIENFIKEMEEKKKRSQERKEKES